ncbi:MAG: hypothetical protein QGI11_16565 [Nitrospinota bacterium]|nr:hypothetical protein [Nitrospinota bacterium]
MALFVHCFRRRPDWLLYLGGFVLLGYELYLWWQDGIWNRYPLSLMVEAFVHSVSVVMEKIPGVQREGVDMWSIFVISDLPYYVARFFQIIPISGFFLVFGYFCIRWHKYVGDG